MKEYQSLNHTRWDCKYHVVFIPKRRKKMIFGKLRKPLGKVLHDLANQKESAIVEGHLMLNYIHMCISIPPKYSVSHVVGFIKGKSAIAIARQLGRGRGISREKVFGLVDILCQRLDRARRWSERISEIRRRKMNVMIS